MKVYLAGPIDLHENNPIVGMWRWVAREHLTRAGHFILDPSTMYPRGAATDPDKGPTWIWEANQQAILDADAVLALLPPGVRTIGTPMEIESARSWGKPVAAICHDTSYQLLGAQIPQYNVINTAQAISALEKLVYHRAFLMDKPVETPVTIDVTIDDATAIKLVVGPDGSTPGRAHEGDAGYDLYVAKGARMKPGETRDFAHDICVEFPPGVWGMITGRSSTIRNRGIMVSQGIIDNGYRGALWTACTNLSGKDVEVETGERLSQLIPFDVTADRLGFVHVKHLSETSRGTNGFGSTGR